MSQFPIFRYKLDLLGTKPENLVTYELVELSAVVGNRTIAPKYGAFYAASMKIRQVGAPVDANSIINVALTGAAPLVVNAIDLGDAPGPVKYVVLSNQTTASENGLYSYTVDGGGAYTLTRIAPGGLLTAGTQYKSFMLNQEATRASGGKFVDQLLVLTDNAVQGHVILEYQAVGGPFSAAPDILEQIITMLDLDNRPVNWHDIVELPPGFNPTPHYHHSSEYFGYGGLIAAIERMTLILLNSTEKTGINRIVLPPIMDYTGPIYGPIDGEPGEERKGDGSFLTYLGKIVPNVIPDSANSRTVVKVNYLTSYQFVGEDETSDFRETRLVEGELQFNFDPAYPAESAQFKNIIRSEDGQDKSKFVFYLEMEPNVVLGHDVIKAVHLFESCSFNRANLVLFSDDASVVFSDGSIDAIIGSSADIVFETITLDLSGVSSGSTIFVNVAGTGDIVLDPITTQMSQFTELTEDESINLSDIKNPFTLMIESMNKTASKLESQVDVISEINQNWSMTPYGE